MSRYSAFISYSHSDQKVARWLHQSLEAYRLPSALTGTPSAFGPVPRRLPPVFRDRDELPASGDLGAHLRAALAESRYQLVLCSPRAAQSFWVNEEILSFKRLHGEGRTLAVILSGEPYSGGDTECFPPALRFCLGPDGLISDRPAEPIAADIRAGKDGRKLALLKLVAGICDVQLSALVRRDAARRQRRLLWITGASVFVMMLTIGLAVYAETQRRAAVRQQLLANRSLDFLIGTFAIANPATDNPKTITALTILNRASQRAGVDLRSEPEVSARLLRATGEIYFNLGLAHEAERDLRSALGRQPARGEERARTLLTLATIASKRGDLPATERLIAEADGAYDKSASYAADLDAEVLEQRALAQTVAGQYAESARLFGEAAQGYRELPGDHREALGRVWMNQARSLVRAKRFKEADQLYAQAETSFVAAFGKNHVRTAAVYQNEALAYFERGDAARAADRIRLAVAIYDRVLEKDHPTIGAALILMGRIQTAQGNIPGAVAALDRARGVYSRAYGPLNAAVGDVDFYAAEAEEKRGAFDAALAMLSRTKIIYDKSYGANDPDQVELLLARSRVQAKAGRTDAARQDCALASQIQKNLSPQGVSYSFGDGKCATLGQAG